MGSDRPGFELCESHAHLSATGRAMAMCDLSAVRSADEMLDRLTSFAPNTSGWVLAHGARPESWETNRWPTLDQLDRATGRTPTLAWCFDYHAMLANSAAMEHARIGPTTAVEHGRIELGATGRPTGVLLEHAAGLMWGAVPEPSEAERAGHVAAALEHLASLGFAEVHDLKSEPWLGPVLAQLERAGRLPCRVRLFPLVENLSGAAANSQSWVSDSVRLGGGKIFTDGTLNSRTAWMLESYAPPRDRPSDDDPELSRGLPMMTHGEIERAVRTCDGLGLPLAAHAIGDGAVRAVLDAVERVRPGTTPGSPPISHRIEHAELIDAADVPRFARLGVVCSVQPCHLLTDIEALRRAVPDRLGRVLPLRELIDSGLEPGRTDGPGLIFGSDIPIVRADPGDSILAATARKRADMRDSDAISTMQSLSADEAWACFRAGPV